MPKKIRQIITFIFALLLLINNPAITNWIKVPEVTGSSCILPIGDIILVGSNNGVYRSEDNGLSWSYFNIDNPNPGITGLAKNEDAIFAGTYNGVYVSADTGKTWNWTGPSYTILSVFANDSVVLACIHGGGLFRSENNGATWTPTDGGTFYSYMVHENKILAGTFSGIFESTDNGATWDFAGLPNKMVTSLSQNTRYFFAANYTHGIYRSEDFGASWTLSNQGLPLDSVHAYSVFAYGSLIFAGFSSNKIYLSRDNGSNWQDFSDGIDISKDTYHVKFAVCGNNIFVSFLYNSLWYFDLSQLTSVSEIRPPRPEKFWVSQNFPNPFNHSTAIRYSIPESGFVVLKIYDVQGHEIRTLVNEFQMANTYTVHFDAKNLPSGIYFYQFRMGKNVFQRGKLVLIK